MVLAHVFPYKIFGVYTGIWPIPVAERSKAWVCSRSPAEIAGSNPSGGMDCSVVSVVCCHVEVSATG